MSYRIGAVVLAGHNDGIKSKSREYLDKSFMSVICGEKFIFGKNKALLPLRNPDEEHKESRSAKKNIEYFVNNLSSSKYVDNNLIIPVGPKKDIEHVLKLKVVEQGNNLSSNIIRSLDFLYNETGYNEDYSLLCCGDLPLPKGKHYDEFIEKCLKDSTKAEVYMGACSRGELKNFINSSPFIRYGRVGINFPLYTRLNKFSLPFVDKKGEFGSRGEIHHLISGNVFLVKKSVKKRKDIADKIYNSKRLFLDPKNWPELIKEFSLYDLYKTLFKQETSIADIEEALSRILNIKLRIIKTNYLFALDVDSWRDLSRNSAILHSQIYERL